MQTKREEELLEENEELKTTLDRLAEFYAGACRDALRYRWSRVDELMKQGRDW